MYTRVGSKVKMNLSDKSVVSIGEIIEIKAFDKYKYVIQFKNGYVGQFLETEFEVVEF